MSTMTFIDTSRLVVLIGEDAKKAFDLRFNKGGVQSSRHGFVGWAGLKIAAGQEMSVGTLTGTEVTEGENAGTTSIALDAEAFDRVAGNVLAHREASQGQETGSNRNGRGTARPAGPDPRTMLVRSIVELLEKIDYDQERAKRNNLGVDYRTHKDNALVLKAEVELAAISKLDAETIQGFRKRLGGLQDTLRDFNDVEVLQAWIDVGRRGLEELSGAIENPTRLNIKQRLDDAEEKGKAGDARAARAVLFGDEGVLANISILRAGMRKPTGDRGGYSGGGRQQFTPTPPPKFSLGDQVEAKAAQAEQTSPPVSPIRKTQTRASRR